MQKGLFSALLQLADDHLVLGHRLSEWCGHAPMLEEDLALPNIALDLIGQARSLYTYAGEIEGVGRDEDALAFCRIEREYQNLLICELPNGDFAQTILRQFYFSSFMLLFWEQNLKSSDATVAAVAGKSIKEAKYHRRHCGEWVIRLGDGTDESARRMQVSCEILEPYLGELFNNSYGSLEISQSGVLPDRSLLQEPWLIDVMEVFQAANLNIPDLTHAHKGGREGRHTEAMGHLLAQLQYMQRSFPDMAW